MKSIPLSQLMSDFLDDRPGDTARRVSRRAGIDPGYLVRLIRGDAAYGRPRPTTLARLADALELSPEDRHTLATTAGCDPVLLMPSGDSVLVGARRACSFANCVVLFDCRAGTARRARNALLDLAREAHVEISCATVYGDHDLIARAYTPGRHVHSLIDRLYMRPDLVDLFRRTETAYLRDDLASLQPRFPRPGRDLQYALVFLRTETAFLRNAEEIVAHVAVCKRAALDRGHTLRVMSAFVMMGAYDVAVELVTVAGAAGGRELETFLEEVAAMPAPPGDPGGERVARLKTSTTIGTPGGWVFNEVRRAGRRAAG